MCGKSFGTLARPLGHGFCVAQHIFDELSVNQSKPLAGIKMGQGK